MARFARRIAGEARPLAVGKPDYGCLWKVNLVRVEAMNGYICMPSTSKSVPYFFQVKLFIG
jgi:hypothetical protein